MDSFFFNKLLLWVKKGEAVKKSKIYNRNYVTSLAKLILRRLVQKQKERNTMYEEISGWNKNLQNFIVTKVLLSVPATQTPVERLFSHLHFILSDLRCDMSRNLIHQLLKVGLEYQREVIIFLVMVNSRTMSLFVVFWLLRSSSHKETY